MTELWQEYYLANISEIRPGKKRNWADRGISAEFLYNIEEISEKERIMAGITRKKSGSLWKAGRVRTGRKSWKNWKKEEFISLRGTVTGIPDG